MTSLEDVPKMQITYNGSNHLVVSAPNHFHHRHSPPKQRTNSDAAQTYNTLTSVQELDGASTHRGHRRLVAQNTITLHTNEPRRQAFKQ